MKRGFLQFWFCIFYVGSELERIERFPRANCGSTKGFSCWARRRAVTLYFCKGKFQVREVEPNFYVYSIILHDL